MCALCQESTRSLLFAFVHLFQMQSRVSQLSLSLPSVLLGVCCCWSAVFPVHAQDPVQYVLANLDERVNPPALVELPSWSTAAATNQLNLTLEVRENRVDLGIFAFNTRSFCTTRDGCSYAGPTLRVTAGSSLSVTLVNALGSDSSAAPMIMNHFRSPNSTNLHTHGVHIDPKVDNVFIHLAPGENHTYQYQLPDAHAPGVHWYHSHMHGSSAAQVLGGLVGAIVVDPVAADNLRLRCRRCIGMCYCCSMRSSICRRRSPPL